MPPSLKAGDGTGADQPVTRSLTLPYHRTGPRRSRLAPRTQLGDRLRRCRLAAGLTQKELGKRAGVSGAAVAAIERGKTAGPRYIVELAYVLDVSPTWLKMGLGPVPLHGASPIAQRRS